jgi:PAS domain S-box-containing protein
MTKTIKSLWKNGMSIGRQKSDLHYLDNQRISLLNSIVIVLVLLCLLIAIFYAITGFNHVYLPLIPIPFSFYIIWLNHNKKHNFARLFAFLSFFIIILFWSFITRRTGAQYFFISLSCISAAVFQKKRVAIWAMVICGLGFLSYSIYDHIIPFYPDPKINYFAINTIFSYITAGVIFFVIMVYRDLTIYVSKSLDIKVDQLKVAQENLKISNDSLVEFINELDFKVKESNEELYAYQNAINDNLYCVVTDLDGKIIQINEPYLKISKYEKEELIGQNFSVLNSNYHNKSFFKSIEETIFTGKVWRGETKNIAKDGGVFWIVSSILPIMNSKKQVIRFFTISSNITEKKKLEIDQENTFKKLAKSEKRFRKLIENQKEFVIISNKNGDRKYVNYAFCEFYGKDKSFFEGTNYRTNTFEKISETYLKAFDSLSFENPSISSVDFMENALGEKKWIQWNEFALFDKKNKITEIISIGYDITLSKELEFQNANAIAQFEEMSFKTSHEFRGPLSSITGIINLLEDNSFTAEEMKDVGGYLKNSVQKLDKSSRELAEFIEKFSADKQIYNEISATVNFSFAKAKHLNWKYKIRNFLNGTGSLRHQQAVSQFDSELGKWYYNEGKSLYGYLEPMQKFEIAHIKLHDLVKEILELNLNGELIQSELKYQKLLDTSDEIVLLLDKSEKTINQIKH